MTALAVAATHRNLATLVAEGKFRADLLARIAGFQLTLPPLRERREDLGLLTSALLARTAAAAGLPLPADDAIRFDLDAARALFRHRFPLNIRELEKCLGTALVLARAESPGGGPLPVALHHLPDDVQAALNAADTLAPAEDDEEPDAPLNEADSRRKDEIAALLRDHGGNVSAVARALGKARMQVQRWLKRYHLDPESFRR